MTNTHLAIERGFLDRDEFWDSGHLRKQAQNFGRDWNRRFFILSPHSLCYYHHPEETIARRQIPLISTSLKIVPSGEKLPERRFRLLTPTREYLLEAETSEEAAEWASALLAAIETRILESTSQQVSWSTSGLVSGSRLLRDELTRLPGNEICADCNVPHPSWVSTNLGIFLCIECSGVHRSLGCQVSRVRSLRV